MASTWSFRAFTSSPAFPSAATDYARDLLRAGRLARGPASLYWRGGADTSGARDDAEGSDIDASADDDYVAYIPAALGAWDPWPTQD